MLKKGTLVWRISSYDNRGTVSICKCVVDSVGKRQMHLRQMDGKMTHRREYTGQFNSELSQHRFSPWIFEVGTVDPEAEALKIAARVIQLETLQFEQILAKAEKENPHYIRTMRECLAAIHEPRIVNLTKE